MGKNYNDNGIEFLLLNSTGALEKDNKKLRVVKSQLKVKYESHRASLVTKTLFSWQQDRKS